MFSLDVQQVVRGALVTVKISPVSTAHIGLMLGGENTNKMRKMKLQRKMNQFTTNIFWFVWFKTQFFWFFKLENKVNFFQCELARKIVFIVLTSPCFSRCSSKASFTTARARLKRKKLPEITEKFLHSKRVEKMWNLHSKRVEKMWNYTRNEWRRCEIYTRNEWRRSKTTLETSGEDVKLHSKRVEKFAPRAR